MLAARPGSKENCEEAEQLTREALAGFKVILERTSGLHALAVERHVVAAQVPTSPRASPWRCATHALFPLFFSLFFEYFSIFLSFFPVLRSLRS